MGFRNQLFSIQGMIDNIVRSGAKKIIVIKSNNQMRYQKWNGDICYLTVLPEEYEEAVKLAEVANKEIEARRALPEDIEEALPEGTEAALNYFSSSETKEREYTDEDLDRLAAYAERKIKNKPNKQKNKRYKLNKERIKEIIKRKTDKIKENIKTKTDEIKVFVKTTKGKIIVVSLSALLALGVVNTTYNQIQEFKQEAKDTLIEQIEEQTRLNITGIETIIDFVDDTRHFDTTTVSYMEQGITKNVPFVFEDDIFMKRRIRENPTGNNALAEVCEIAGEADKGLVYAIKAIRTAEEIQKGYRGDLSLGVEKILDSEKER